jgi:hypothetical protein
MVLLNQQNQVAVGPPHRKTYCLRRYGYLERERDTIYKDTEQNIYKAALKPTTKNDVPVVYLVEKLKAEVA